MSTAVLRHSSRDALLVALAGVHGVLLATVPSAALVAVGLWWTANTVAHNFIHLPFFRTRGANAAFSAYLSLLLGVPQTVWRDRHLAHHAGKPWRTRWSAQLGLEIVLVAGLWTAMALRGPEFFLGTWVAGWGAGLVLCALQGHFEHARGVVSHYGRVYNSLFFNDGFHVEHHARPGLHWTELPRESRADGAPSRWPAVLRWLELCQLDALEKLVLRSRWLQRFVVARHAAAFRRALAELPAVRRVTIVGGGLFPRTALVLREVLPHAEVTIVDRSAANIARARAFVDGTVRVIEASYRPELCAGADLVVIPLAFDGDRDRFYEDPPAPAVALHEWLWRRRGQGYVISLPLLKRLNLVRR
jgi:hypothetical protein